MRNKVETSGVERRGGLRTEVKSVAMSEIPRGGLMNTVLTCAAESCPWLRGAAPYDTNCSCLKNKERFRELKEEGKHVRDSYEKKKFKIVMEELAIVNLFLIPLLHMLIIIPWVRLILTPLLRFANPVLLGYFKTRFFCKKILAPLLNAYCFTLGAV